MLDFDNLVETGEDVRPKLLSVAQHIVYIYLQREGIMFPLS